MKTLHRAALLAAGTIFILVSGITPAVAQAQGRGNQQPPTAARGADQQDLSTLSKAVSAMLMTDPLAVAPPTASDTAVADVPDQTQGDIPVTWASSHFVKAPDGSTLVLFTLAIDGAAVPAKNVALYMRLVTPTEAQEFATTVAALKAASEKDRKNVKLSTFSAEGVTFFDLPDGGRVSRGVPLKPGRYVLFAAVKPSGASAGTPKVGLLRHEFIVPDFNAGFATSSVIVAQKVEMLPSAPTAEQAAADPYLFGQMRVVPSVDGKFTRQTEVVGLFWIYGSAPGPGGKPDVLIESSFYRQQPEGEKYFNKTAPQPLNAETLPAQFNLAAGHQLLGTVAVPLASFPPADYRLEIKVTDRPSGKTVVQNVKFTVAQ